MNTSLFGLNTISRRRPAHTLLAAALLAVAMVSGPVRAEVAFEYEEVVAATDLAELESAFWACDHAASTRGVDGTQAVQCGSITEELKLKRFGGSFEQLLDWWNANKVAQYAMLERLVDDRVAVEESFAFEAGFPESI